MQYNYKINVSRPHVHIQECRPSQIQNDPKMVQGSMYDLDISVKTVERGVLKDIKYISRPQGCIQRHVIEESSGGGQAFSLLIKNGQKYLLGYVMGFERNF